MTVHPLKNINCKLFLKLCLAFCFAFAAICIFTMPEKLRDSTFEIILRRSQSDRKRHTILLWTPYFGTKDWLPSTTDLECPVRNCDVTSDRNRYTKSSALIIHWRDFNPDDLPKCPEKATCPLTVLFNKEAPTHTSVDTIKKINDKIVWTATYRRDSDIYAPYGKVILRDDVAEMPDINLNRSSICWLVSNCHTSSHRENYVNDLKRIIPVDVYGKCGSHTCPHKHPLDCHKLLSKHCRFYLSFENSICKDYSTEKLYYPMMAGMVPIVLGGDDYAQHLPPHSYIDAKNFSSPQELAKYLIELKMMTLNI